MKRKWLYIGIALASCLQFFFEGMWYGILFTNSYEELHPILRNSPHLMFNFLSEAAFASLVGFFYLHVPNERRGLRSGIIIGTILGLLIGLYQFLGWYGSFDLSAYVIFLEIIKAIFLGTICGAAISFAELRINPRTKSRAI